MKKNTILTVLGFTSSAQPTFKQVTKRLINVTAFTVGCVISLPSFSGELTFCQLNPSECATVDGTSVIGDGDTPYWWGGLGGGGNTFQGSIYNDPCDYYTYDQSGCYDTAYDDQGGYSEPINCPRLAEVEYDAAVCWASVTGGSIALVGSVASGSCSTCLFSLNPIACGSCLVLTGVSAILFDQAVQQCGASDQLIACMEDH